MRTFTKRVIPGLFLILGMYNFSRCGLPSAVANVGRPAVQEPRDTDLALTPTIVNLTQNIPGLKTDVRYATTHNFTGQVLYASGTPYLVAEVAESLLTVQNELRNMGLQLLVFDGYRPLAVQKKMWKIYPDSRYVANPVHGSRHNRGCAVDLTLADSTGQPLVMPTGYDDFTEKANAGFRDLPAQQLANRALLKLVMEKHGFVGLKSEWWHFDFRGWRNYPVLDIPIPAER